MLNWYIEQAAWTMLQVYFAPFKMPALMGRTPWNKGKSATDS